MTAILGTGDREGDVELGKSGDAGSVWARDPSKPAVFTVGQRPGRRAEKDSRSTCGGKKSSTFRPFNTTRFEITRGKEYARVRAGEGKDPNGGDTWKQTAPAAKTVDSSNFEGRCSNSRTSAPKPLLTRIDPAMGLNIAAATITVKFEDGKKEERVVIGQRGPDVYAVRPDQPGAMKVEMGKYEAALKKLDSIQ